MSALGTVNKAQAACFRTLNEHGGIAGRKINHIIYDDDFAPPKTLEMTRRLEGQDEVAFLFSQLGTGQNSAIVNDPAWAGDAAVKAYKAFMAKWFPDGPRPAGAPP